MENQEIKEKIKTCLVTYLTQHGYPNMNENAILQHLKPMWIALEDAGLIQSGMTFQAFSEHATSQATFSQMKNMFGIGI